MAENASTKTVASEIKIGDLFTDDPAIKGCPFAHFDKLRAIDGLYYAPEVEAYLVARYADAIEILSDPDRFSSKIPFGRVAMRKERDAIEALGAENAELSGLLAALRPRRIPMLASADQPGHKRQRRLVQSAFAPRRLNKAEPWLRKTAEELINAFPDNETVDAVAGLTVPLPVRAIAILMGVDESQQEQFKRWSDNFFFSAGNGALDVEQLNASLHGQVDLFAYVARQVAEHRSRPQEDIITDVLEASEKTDDPLSLEEMQAMFSQLLVAGNETTTGLLGSSLLVLAQRPDLFDALASDQTAIPRFVDETVRREFPVAATFRMARCDTTVGGFPIKAGDQLMVLPGAANNDPAMFGNDELTAEFIAKPRHVAFGNGIHFCVGAPLAKLEAKIVIEILVQRFSRITLDETQSRRYAPFYLNRAPSYLPMRFARRR